MKLSIARCFWYLWPTLAGWVSCLLSTVQGISIYQEAQWQKPMLHCRQYHPMFSIGRKSLQFYYDFINLWSSVNLSQCCPREILGNIGLGQYWEIFASAHQLILPQYTLQVDFWWDLYLTYGGNIYGRQNSDSLRYSSPLGAQAVRNFLPMTGTRNPITLKWKNWSDITSPLL